MQHVKNQQNMIKIKNLTRIKKINCYIISFFCLFFVITSCSSNQDESKVLGKKTYEPNLKKRMAKQAEEGGGIFSSGKNTNRSGTFEFATSNVLWRATLKAIDFIPLQSANYSGGLIITDWYSSSLKSKESIKLEIRFFSNELSSTSLDVKSYKKICNEVNKCFVQKGNREFDFEIKNNILNEARKISLKELKQKK